MSKILRNILSRDAPINANGELSPYRPEFKNVRAHGYGFRRSVRDTLLNALSPGKCLVLGTVWDGDLKPFVDGYMSALQPIVSGFTLGRTLNAEGSDTLDLGRVWLGALGERIADAVTASSGASAGSTVDLAPLATATSNLQEAIEANATARAADAFRAMRAARDALSREEREVQEALQHDGLAGVNERTRGLIRNMQSASDKRWNGATTDATSQSAVRDGLHAAATATSERSRLEALNGVNKSFWDARRPAATTDSPAAPPRTPAPTSLAQMNERNLQFWAGNR